MSDPMKQAWNDVGDDFTRLGKAMKERYQGRAAENAPDTDRSDADAGVRAAFERLLAAGREFGDRIADVVAGDEVRAQAKQTGKRLNDAMATTADLLGEQVRGAFKGGGRHADAVDADAEDAPPGGSGGPVAGDQDAMTEPGDDDRPGGPLS